MVKGVKALHSCAVMHLTYGEGWFLRIKIVCFMMTWIMSAFPISVLKGAFQEAFHVLRVI